MYCIVLVILLYILCYKHSIGNCIVLVMYSNPMQIPPLHLSCHRYYQLLWAKRQTTLPLSSSGKGRKKKKLLIKKNPFWFLYKIFCCPAFFFPNVFICKCVFSKSCPWSVFLHSLVCPFHMLCPYLVSSVSECPSAICLTLRGPWLARSLGNNMGKRFGE